MKHGPSSFLLFTRTLIVVVVIVIFVGIIVIIAFAVDVSSGVRTSAYLHIDRNVSCHLHLLALLSPLARWTRNSGQIQCHLVTVCPTWL